MTCILLFIAPLFSSILETAGLNLHIKEELGLGSIFT